MDFCPFLFVDSDFLALLRCCFFNWNKYPGYLGDGYSYRLTDFALLQQHERRRGGKGAGRGARPFPA